jgi:hypothetical protein
MAKRRDLQFQLQTLNQTKRFYHKSFILYNKNINEDNILDLESKYTLCKDIIDSVALYLNTQLQKEQIMKENKRKSGIYR